MILQCLKSGAGRIALEKRQRSPLKWDSNLSSLLNERIPFQQRSEEQSAREEAIL
ncbi:hypothetical protein [Paenibacillus polymyxa]|uniref:hypothetical protein n=1 Tax=Paenibacillus polymyxa TaxID=1406 RepID=UPI0018AD5B28|nr:hypothetical protein [Paenibacillus polymyxa]